MSGDIAPIIAQDKISPSAVGNRQSGSAIPVKPNADVHVKVNDAGQYEKTNFQQLDVKSLSLKDYLHLQSGAISSLLRNGVVRYSDMKLPSGYFDFIQARSKNMTSFFRMANAFKFNCNEVENAVEQHIVSEFKNLLNKDNELGQVRNIALHIMCRYLNHIGCPSQFAQLY